MSIIADALNGKPRPAIYPAKRGDLAVVELTHSAVFLHGPSTRTTTYHLRRVTNVTKDGRVSGYLSRDATGHENHQKPRAGVTYPCRVASQSRVDVVACFDALCACEFTSWESARDAVRHYLKD